MIDGNGRAFFGPNLPGEDHLDVPGWRPGQMITFSECQDVSLRDVHLIDSPNWTVWPQGCDGVHIHDGNYPKIGALHNFSTVYKDLREDGGTACPYVVLGLFDQGAAENSPYAAEARPNVLRGLYGVMRTWPGEAPWEMCPATQWWRNRLKEQCALLLEREHVGGIYLDVMVGCSSACYWTPHGHSAAGADTRTRAMYALVEIIYDAVKAADPDAIITGENPGENMIDVIDGMLEMTLKLDNTAPVFAAVYQDYIKRMGMEVSTWDNRTPSMDPNFFFIECASMFTEGMQMGRLRLRPRSGVLSFQNPEYKQMLDFLGRLVGYYRQQATRKVLAYGQLMRPLDFREPSPMPMLAYKGGVKFPALMSGVFRSYDGELGIFVVSTGSKDQRFEVDMELARHCLTRDAIVDVHSITSDGTTKNVLSSAKGKVSLKGSLPGRGATMYLIEPSEFSN